MNDPDGITTISGQEAQSLKVSLGWSARSGSGVKGCEIGGRGACGFGTTTNCTSRKTVFLLGRLLKMSFPWYCPLENDRVAGASVTATSVEISAASLPSLGATRTHSGISLVDH
jgi:hypothetical protein